jgi:hypothetical protein
MAHDLFLKDNTRNWSREPLAATPEFVAVAKDSRAKNQVARLAAIKTAADKGDKKAQKKWSKVQKRAAALKAKAAKGDPKAVRKLQALEKSGLLGKKAAVSGVGAFVGKDEILGSSLASKAFGAVKKVASLPLDITEWAVKHTPKPTGFSFIGKDEILGYNGHLAFTGDLGEEEVALAREGGACERAALRRRY